jgi:hypothetical protein
MENPRGRDSTCAGGVDVPLKGFRRSLVQYHHLLPPTYVESTLGAENFRRPATGGRIHDAAAKQPAHQRKITYLRARQKHAAI